MLTKNATTLLFFIYACNEDNVGAELSAADVNDDSNKFIENWNELYKRGLVFGGEHRKNKLKSAGIYCKITAQGRKEAENSFKLYVLRSLVIKEQFSWSELKLLLAQEFHCPDIPEHIRKFGLRLIQELVCIGILTYDGSSYNFINAVFNINKDKFNKK